MTENKKPNHLIHEKSPYLLQHAYNPVDWFPWGQEAFEKAKSENKVVFLSIGYATCHWCHVMERESFEDERTAEILNRYFVAVKLDREERPDLDKIYMDAIHATGQQGGWPLNFFLTPDKMPIFGGTYFPPENRYGRKSFIEVLTLVQRSWENHREDLVAAANDLTQHLRKTEKTKIDSRLPDDTVFQTSFSKYTELYDTKYFGFVFNGPNKFPPSMALEYLINFHHYFPSDFALEMAYNTVVAMKKGGIYDQVGGGISRYSTDHEWLVPHFEKMLYDNSLFLKVISILYKITKHSFFSDCISDITGYIRRDMALPEGGISSAEDADSEGEEGKFYVWTHSELRDLIRDPEILRFWNVTEGGNFEDHNILNESIEGTNPFRTKTKTDHVSEEKLAGARKILLQTRSKRVRPERDDKVILSWNCLYIQALLNSFEATKEVSYLEEAQKIYEFILKRMRKPDGFLFRRYRDGEARFQGNLCDYAEFILSSLLLFRETEEDAYFGIALETLSLVETHFATGYGPFYDSISHNDDLIVRTVDGYDGVEPSGNSSMAHVYNFLVGLGVNASSNHDKASKIFQHFSKELSTNTTSYPSMLDAYLHWKNPRMEIIVIYKKEFASEIQEIKDYLRSSHLPNVMWLVREEGVGTKSLEEISLLSDRNAGSTHQVYVCQNFACQLPVKGLDAMKKLIEKLV